MSASNWYTAILIFRSRRRIHGSFIIDHEVRLIQAASPDAAFERATAIGSIVRPAHLNDPPWDFLGLSDLSPLWDSPPREGSMVHNWGTVEPEQTLVEKLVRATLGRLWPSLGERLDPSREHVPPRTELTVFAETRDTTERANRPLDK
jgi:hypothetical protein